MAEVGQRLAYGVCRASVLTHSLNRPFYAGERPGFLLESCSFSNNRTKDESTQERLELQPAAKAATKRRPVSVSHSQENGSFCCVSSSEPDRSSFVGVVQTYRPSLQHYQQQLLPGRVTARSRGDVRLDTFSSSQQLRAFCTVIFILVEPGSERPCRGLRKRRSTAHPGGLPVDSFSRSYSRRGDGDSKQAHLPRRSRTAYYDILQVSPVATASQIKTAYYKLSFIHHPDKNPGNDQALHRFFEVSQAYTVLGNAHLRRKYDRGILSQSDIQNAGRPSSKETVSRAKGTPQHQDRVRQFSQTGGKTIFDFDAFYRAHYGEQLKRERDMKARKQRREEQQRENLHRWKQDKMLEMTFLMVLATAGYMLFSLGS